MNEEEKSKIEGLTDTLNSRTRYKDPLDRRTPVKALESEDVEGKWQSPEIDEMLKHERIPHKVSPFMKKVFIFSLLFFVATIFVAGFIFIGGTNFVSSKNVNITVLGPTMARAGETLELGVTVSNTNSADLEFANLSIQYPQGSRSPDNTAESLTYTKDNLGVVKAGDEIAYNTKVVLLGSSGETKEIKFSVEYKVKGSNATFYKDKIFEITIGDAPVTLLVESPHSVTSGGSFETKVSVTLNSTDILKDVVLKAEYPHGYSVTDATPEAVSNGNTWSLGDMSPGDKKTISIRGDLLGEDGEERTFRFYVGVSDSGSADSNLKIVIVSLLNTVAIDRPSIGLEVAFNGEDSDGYIAPAARPVSTTIRFQNNLSDKLLNPRLEVTLLGAALDKSSITTTNNSPYNPISSKIAWGLVNPLGNPELGPGEGGQVSFRFSSLPGLSLVGGSNDIVLNILITGVPVDAVGQDLVTVKESHVVKISSQINLFSKVLRTLGPFANYGPIPPKAGEETSYTVVLSLLNNQNTFSDSKVTAKLGNGVEWVGGPTLGSESIVYDSISKTVTWDIGILSSATDSSSGTREVSFQVSLNPSLSQIGTVPILVNSILFTGRDTNGGEVSTVNNPPLTTSLTSDPAFIQGDDIVVK
ncbi:MAG: hypothetical protein WAX80_01950 [Minisyncoccia bacterium]